MNEYTMQKRLLNFTYSLFVFGLMQPIQVDAKEPQASEVEIHTVKQSPLKIVVELNGTAVAKNMAEVVVEQKVWKEWSVKSAVPHGIRVGKGDVLARFDTTKIDEAIADLEVEVELLDLTITQANRELPLFKKTLAMDTADAERDLRIARDDTQHYLEVEKAMAKKNTEFSLKSSQQRYENTLEELIQLEKMYEGDDLIEETEEIILKRQRHAVAAAQLYLERATIAHDRAMSTGLPRAEESTQRKLARNELSTTKVTSMAELTLKQKQLEHQKKKIKRSRQQEKLVKLQHDRKAMVVHAPAAGTVYYGQCVDGKWDKINSMRSKLRAHGKVQANEIIMTIVADGPKYLVATVPEADFSTILPGVAATITFPALGEEKVKGRVESISSTLVSEGKFAMKLTLANSGRIEGLTPGMSCDIKIVPYANRSTILLPQSAVLVDDWNDEIQSVFLVNKEGKAEKKAVKTGYKKDEHLEILSGLEPGDRVLLDAKGAGE